MVSDVRRYKGGPKNVLYFWQKNVHKYWLTVWRTKPDQEKVRLGKLFSRTMARITPLPNITDLASFTGVIII